MNRFTRAALATLAALPIALEAHPGHGVMEQGAGHVVTSPYHLAVLLMVAVGCLAGARLAAAPGIKRIFIGVGATALVAMAALWAVGV